MTATDALINAILTGADDPIITGLIEAAQHDIAKRHAQHIKSDVNYSRCDVQIIAVMGDGTQRQLL